jgi:hypothetical protein
MEPRRGGQHLIEEPTSYLTQVARMKDPSGQTYAPPTRVPPRSRPETRLHPT